MRTTPGQSAAATDCDAQAVASRLRAVRLGAGVTQSELGRRLGTTQSAVARLEAGRQRLDLATVRRVASALGCEAELVIRPQRTS